MVTGWAMLPRAKYARQPMAHLLVLCIIQKSNANAHGFWKTNITTTCRVPFWRKKTVTYVTVRPNSLRQSRREVKNDVWKYLQTIVIGLYAVCGHLLDNQDRAFHLVKHGNKAASDTLYFYTFRETSFKKPLFSAPTRACTEGHHQPQMRGPGCTFERRAGIQWDRFHLIISGIGIFSSGEEFLNWCFHFIICTRHVRVLDFVSFRSVPFNIPIGKTKVEGTPTERV